MIALPPRTGLFGALLKKPPLLIAWILSAALLLLVAALNMGPLAGVYAGFAYFLPLLLCLWTRNRLLLYLMAVIGSALSFYKTFILIPQIPVGATTPWTTWSFQLINIWFPALAVHLGVFAFDRLDLKRKLLFDANEELNETNKELTVREGEVLQQNQELQTQAEELERQAEELRQQAEELEQQTMELHAANEELTRRERGLQTLLESARWMRSDLSERDVMSAICQAAVQVIEEGINAAAVVHDAGGKLALRGHYGFGVHGTLRDEIRFDQSFAHLVMQRRQTAYLADVRSRPDVLIPQPAAGREFRSALATPLIIEGRIMGAVMVFAYAPREWTDGEFKVIEWLAAQCALAVQAIEYQREVVVKRREAEEASIQKTRFLAAISHDVRTPANAISLLADLIEQTAVATTAPNAADATAPGTSHGARDGKPQSAAGVPGNGAADAPNMSEIPALARDLKFNARSLVELVSDVLDLSRLDTGKLDLQISDFALDELLHTEFRQFNRIAEEKQLQLIVHPIPPELCLRTDRLKLARIISNLVGNAIKFTQTGSVELRTTHDERGAVLIAITDTGMGIAADALPRIFDEFYQIQNPERDRNKGSGLGLAICKRLVDALGCSLSVESILGVGTTFTIKLEPELVAPPPTAHPHGEPQRLNHARQFQGVTILLVEDHEVTRRAAARLLARAGATVLEARDAREALRLLMHEQPNVLLLDLMLPDADGTDILRHLRLHRPTSLHCILAVSGDVREARAAEVRELGANDLLAKPLDIEKLLSVISRHLDEAGFPVAT